MQVLEAPGLGITEGVNDRGLRTIHYNWNIGEKEKIIPELSIIQASI